MEKPVREKFPCNKFVQKTSVIIFEAKTIAEGGCNFFFILLFLFNLVIWSPRALQSRYQQIDVPIQEENVCLKTLAVEVQIATTPRFPVSNKRYINLELKVLNVLK